MRTLLLPGTMSDLWTHQDQESFLVVMSLFSQPANLTLFSHLCCIKTNNPSPHTQKQNNNSQKQAWNNNLLFFAMLWEGWAGLALPMSLAWLWSAKTSGGWPEMTHLILSRPSFGMSGMAGILSLSLHEIYHWRFFPCWEKHSQRERAKNKVSGGHLEISKLLWPYSNKTEHKVRADSRGRRFHLFRGSRAKRMGGMVAAIFANNLPYVFNIRKSIMIRAEKKKKYVSLQYMKKRHVIKFNTYSRFKQKQHSKKTRKEFS